MTRLLNQARSARGKTLLPFAVVLAGLGAAGFALAARHLRSETDAALLSRAREIVDVVRLAARSLEDPVRLEGLVAGLEASDGVLRRIEITSEASDRTVAVGAPVAAEPSTSVRWPARGSDPISAVWLDSALFELRAPIAWKPDAAGDAIPGLVRVVLDGRMVLDELASRMRLAAALIAVAALVCIASLQVLLYLALENETGKPLRGAASTRGTDSSDPTRFVAGPFSAINTERLEIAVNSFADGFWDWDRRTGVLWCSTQLGSSLGYDGDELPLDLDAWSARLHPRDRETVLSAARAHLEQGRAYDVVGRWRVRDGSYRWFRFRGVAVREGSGAASRLAGVVVDVNDQKRAEIDRERLLRDVSVARDLAEDRARQIQAQAQELARARQQAVMANRSKSQFLANMSHEIRTPMTAILGYADLLLEADGTEEDRRQYLETIRRNGDHLLSIINDILDLSKIELGKMLVERTEVSISQIVDDVVSLLRVRAHEVGVKLEVEYRHPLPSIVRSDPVRLRQILVNLVNNAIKFTERGSVRIVVFLEGKGASAALRFQVQDTGIGMPASQVERLFQPYAQAEVSTARKYGGTGLGLTISKRLAQLLGGDVELLSTSERGTTFEFAIDPGSLEGIPLIERRGDPPRPDRRHRRLEEPTSPSGGRLEGKILLAEDNPVNRKLAIRILESFGLRVDTADNGRIACESALEALSRGEPYDVIIMDMQMPEMDGYTATGRLRDSGYTGAIIALTANAMTGDRERCLAAGCDDYAAKPFGKKQLREILAPHVRTTELTGEQV